VENIELNMKQFMKQQDLFIESLTRTTTTCTEVREERSNHVRAIEHSRNKKLYTKDVQYIVEAIQNQGKNEYLQLINTMKKDILGKAKIKEFDIVKLEKIPKDI